MSRVSGGGGSMIIRVLTLCTSIAAYRYTCGDYQRVAMGTWVGECERCTARGTRDHETRRGQMDAERDL